MRVNKVISRRVRRQSNGIDIAADINAAIVGNVNEPGSQTHVRSVSSNRIVQTRHSKASGASDQSDQPEQSMEVDQ